MCANNLEDPAATAALQDIVNIYRQLDADDIDNSKPLSGADVVKELGHWIDRNHKLLLRLGILEDLVDLT